MSQPFIQIQQLNKYFYSNKGFTKKTMQCVSAVDNVDLSINKGDIVGLVGESGCGKSTLGRCILRLIEPTHGTVQFAGKKVTDFNNKELKVFRKQAQIIFQDPYTSLNPRMTVFESVVAPLDVYNIGTKKERKEQVSATLHKVGIEEDALMRFPHEFSGGQRQRIGIARALITNPSFIVCDEPVSALDVSVRAQVLNLMSDLKDEYALTYLFISHDLSVVKHISNKIAVMYLGRVVEYASTAQIFDSPMHPYTIALQSAIPKIKNSHQEKKIVLQGDVPSPYAPPSGCRFHTRCPYATKECSQISPELTDKGDGHFVSCHHCQNRG